LGLPRNSPDKAPRPSVAEISILLTFTVACVISGPNSSMASLTSLPSGFCSTK
jgi:hypothetical protein